MARLQNQFNPSRSWMNPAELTTFERLREVGDVSIYRIALCPCGREIPKSKTFCSRACLEAAEQTKNQEVDSGK